MPYRKKLSDMAIANRATLSGADRTRQIKVALESDSYRSLIQVILDDLDHEDDEPPKAFRAM